MEGAEGDPGEEGASSEGAVQLDQVMGEIRLGVTPE